MFPCSLALFLSLLTAASASTSSFDSVECAARARALALSNSSTSVFLVKPDGSLTANLSEAWGITYPACLDLCGTGIATFNWVFFATSISSWLLPWLALAAQLPFETKDVLGDIMSFFLAVGSPALVTCSLAITVLNTRWINEQFRCLKDWNAELGGNIGQTLDDVCRFLIESQCVLIQVVLGPQREFAQLVVDPAKRKWWRHVVEQLEKTRREWTYSLRFQIMFVFIAQILAAILFFSTPDANNTGGLGVTMNSIWTWMIPVCLGWVWVGSQTSHSGIRDALKSASQNIIGQCVYGIRDRTGDEKRVLDHGEEEDIELQPLIGNTTAAGSKQWLYTSIAGDAIEPGPIYNYARLWPHMAAARDIANAFKSMNLHLGGGGVAKLSVKGESWNEDDYDANLVGDPHQMAAFIGLENNGEDMPLYSVKSPPDTVKRMLLAAIVGLFVQWGTTGSAIVIAYYTPVVGLGCLSGSYLLYGLSATGTWLLLVLSSWLSQSQCSSARPPISYPNLAVVTRRLGKFLAIISTLWVILVSGLQFSNVFNSCWCNSCAVTRGTGVNSYVILFATNDAITNLASRAWIFGVVWSFVTVLVALVFVFVGKGSLKRIGQ